MRCDVLAVGTELLLGQIVDSNSAWIGEQLAAAGVSSHLHVQVGDNVGRIEAELRRLLDYADAVIVCGGLGPTHDDVTREATAAVMGVELVADDAVADTIAEMFATRRRPMPDNNLRQALVPVGATVIPQQRGTAPGLICPVTVDGGEGAIEKVVYLVPGVPHELHEMVHRAVLPDLIARAGEPGVIVSRTLKTWGESESGLNERLDDIVARLDGDPGGDRIGEPTTLAFLARGWNGLEIRLTTRAATTAAGVESLEPLEAEIRERLGRTVFGADDDSMESVVLDALRKRSWTLGLAESLTAGLVASRLASVSGASDVLRGGVVSYAADVKHSVLAVPDGPIVTEEAAIAMADGARRVFGADVGLALTGVAGPDPQPGEEWVPVGTVCVAVTGVAGERSTTLRLGRTNAREQVRQFAVISSLDLLRRLVS